ncbi:MAG: efflux RND transporter permease subunit [Candidatus Velthaea sp.]
MEVAKLSLARFVIRNGKVIVFVVAVLALLGVRAYFTTPQSIFPTMSFSRIVVVAEAGDLPPDQVRVAVTRPLEQALQTLPSVTMVLSTSSQGSADLQVQFDPQTDPRGDLQAVNGAIAEIRASIPAATNIIAVIVNPNSEPILSYALTSKTLSQAVVRNLALFTLLPRLYGVEGMGHVAVAGGPVTEYHVDLDPSALVAAGIGAADVAKAISDANAVQAVGLSQRYYQRYAIIVDSSVHDASALAQIPVPLKNGGSVSLASLGRVRLGVAPLTYQTSYDAAHAVLLNVYALPGADTVKMAAQFRAKLADAQRRLPADVQVSAFWDQTTLIIESQKALRNAILLGAILAIVVIYVFLRNYRLTLVAAAMIPIAMAIAIFGLQQSGFTLNLMSVGGLAVAVGLIIDDAIVVIEGIERYSRESPGAPIFEPIQRALSRLSGPMVASTATTVVVFLPLALLTGVTGFFFRALALTLATSLIVSLVLAIILAPILARRLLAGHEGDPRHRDRIAAVLDRYEPILRWTLAHRPVVFGTSAVVLAITVLLLANVPSDFLPRMDEGQFEIAYTLPSGISLPASDAAATKMEKIIIGDPAVASVGRLTGLDSNGYSPTQTNQGLLRVRLKPPGERSSYDAVGERLRPNLEGSIPASRFDFHQILEDLINDLSGTPAPVEVILKGPDQATLIRLAGKLVDKIGEIHGIVDPNSGVVYVGPSLRIAPHGTRLAAMGITSSDVGDAVSALTQGTVATNLAGTQSRVPVRVSVGAGLTTDIAAQDVYAKGFPTALGDLAGLHAVGSQSEINAINGQSVIRLTANIAGANLSTVTAGINRVLRSRPLPAGYTAEIGGQALSQRRSFSEFLNVIAIAVALVFGVMLATFRSYRLPLVILTTSPLALIGVALGLFITRTPLNVSSFMGLLLLVGLVVKNGILLIDVANSRVQAGDGIEDALAIAGRTRLRPIVMTTLAAIGGLLPLALGIGQGAEMERPLAIAVIGGLSTATIFTLLVIPTLYATLVGYRQPAISAGAQAA